MPESAWNTMTGPADLADALLPSARAVLPSGLGTAGTVAPGAFSTGGWKTVGGVPGRLAIVGGIAGVAGRLYDMEGEEGREIKSEEKALLGSVGAYTDSAPRLGPRYGSASPM